MRKTNRLTTIRLRPITIEQIEALDAYGEMSQIVAVAIDRLWREERDRTRQPAPSKPAEPQHAVQSRTLSGQ